MTFQFANSNLVYRASVYLIGKEISPERTVGVHCHLDKLDKSFLPGMFVTANIEATSKYVDVVPVNAISNFEGKDFISSYLQVIINLKRYPSLWGLPIRTLQKIQLPKDLSVGKSVVIHGAFELVGLLKNKQE